MDVTREYRALTTRRQFFGRTAAGIGTASNAALLTSVPRTTVALVPRDAPTRYVIPLAIRKLMACNDPTYRRPTAHSSIELP